MGIRIAAAALALIAASTAGAQTPPATGGGPVGDGPPATAPAGTAAAPSQAPLDTDAARPVDGAAPAPATPPAATAAGSPPTPADDDDNPAAATASPAAAPAGHHDYGPSGIMVRTNREDLPPLTLASGKPLAAAPYALKSGGYYRIDIIADGSAELALSGGDFFRAIWVNEVVVNDIEIRPMGLHSLEFDDAGTASLSFVAIVPGRYTLSIPGSSGEGQRASFVIE